MRCWPERGLQLTVEERHRLVRAWHHLDPWPRRPGRLEALRRRHVIAALFNGLTAARLLGAETAELMMVAAHPWDLDGARGAGLQTALIERPLEYGPGSAAHTYPDADESAADLVELAERLGG
jgi:2-haloacid dehalogenase